MITCGSFHVNSKSWVSDKDGEERKERFWYVDQDEEKEAREENDSSI